MIEQMLTRNCSSEEEFNKIKAEYQTSLKNSGYTYQLKFNPRIQQKKRNRKRVITWFNPPWGDNVKTNIAEKFLRLIDEMNVKC